MNPQTKDDAFITITSTDVTKKCGTKNGKDWEIREQAATLETVDRKQPVQLDLGHDDPHAPGIYRAHFSDNINVSQFGSVQMRRKLVLTKVADLPASKPAARAAA
jgi:hypothetical protein